MICTAKRKRRLTKARRPADDEAKRGRSIAEFLAQSEICDEVGILLADGDDWCLGIFLDRSTRLFRDTEIQFLEERFSIFAALHELDTATRAPSYLRTDAPTAPGAAPVNAALASAELWPELSGRERELVDLILKGRPNATIALRFGIAAGTVKNHRGPHLPETGYQHRTGIVAAFPAPGIIGTGIDAAFSVRAEGTLP